MAEIDRKTNYGHKKLFEMKRNRRSFVETVKRMRKIRILSDIVYKDYYRRSYAPFA